MGAMTSVGDLPAYRAVPAGEGPWPALVVVHEAFGLDDEMRRHADRLAGMGFLALVPDLFARGRPALCLARTLAALRKGEGQAFDDIEAARSAVLADAGCNGAVGVIGFCLGGGFALVLAGRPGWDAAAANYGALPRDLDALEGACPVLASYGGRDGYLRGAAGTLEAALTERGVEHDVKEYPTAGHAYLDEEVHTPWWMAPVTRLVMHVGHDPVAAADTWRRIEVFLHRRLTT